MNTSTNRLEEIKRIGSCAGSGAALFCVRREPEPGLLTYCPKVDTKIQKILLGATFRVVLTPLSRHGTIIKIICERVNCAMVSIREGLSCCDKTHGAVFLPHAVSGAFFCLRGYAAQSREARCKNSRSAERGCSSVHPPPNRRRMGGGDNLAPPPTGYRRAIARSAVQKQPERRALRPQARFGAQPPQAALGAEIGCSSVHPPPNRRRMGEGDNLALLLGGAANPAPPPTSYRRAAQSWHLT